MIDRSKLRSWMACGAFCVAIVSLPPVSDSSPETRDAGRLIGYVPLPDWSAVCLMPETGATAQSGAGAQAGTGRPTTIGGDPIRMIRDPYPSFSAVAVDVTRDEVIAADENLLQILAYDRRANTPAAAAMTEPRRILGGARTKIEFVCGLHVDERTGDVYGINNDTENTMVVFARDQSGNVAPVRELETPHGTYGIAVDEERQELFLTIQHDSAIVVYAKHAKGSDPPVRRLQGDRTALADPHGIAIDRKNDLMFVTNHGSASSRQMTGAAAEGDHAHPNWPLGRDQAILGSGKFRDPSITVYARTAAGDTAPVRIITGPRTRLNMPTGAVFDDRRGELLVANDMDDSIVVFSGDADGDAAPVRVLKGPKTGLKNPTGLFLDTRNDELWVANFGGNGLTVYRSSASGDTAPLRVVRSRPGGSSALMIGNPGALAYDTKREQLLVPN